MVVRSVGRWLVTAVIAAGCQNSARESAPVRHDQPCTPSLHAKAEARRGPPLFEAYRFLGASADGKRVALMVTHMGPGSGQPVGGAHVVEAGEPKEVLAKSYFNITGTEADLPKVEQGIANEYAGELATAGVEVGTHLPTQQAWCTDPTGTIYTANGGELALRVTHLPCEKSPNHQNVGWQVCSKDGARCASGGPAGCIDGQVTVHDVLRAGAVDWIVVDLATKPFPDTELHLFQTGGGLITGS